MAAVGFAIVTGLTEELAVLDALFREFGIRKFREVSDNAEVWYRTRISAGDDRSYEVAASFQNDMGPV
jgi:hypothetical protein